MMGAISGLTIATRSTTTDVTAGVVASQESMFVLDGVLEEWRCLSTVDMPEYFGGTMALTPGIDGGT
jgi:hypothetical protein